jgi:hypothetical protein
MSETNGASEKNGEKRTREEEMVTLIENGDWDALDRMLGWSREEDERILREEPMIDAAEINRLFGITDEEIAEVQKNPPQEIRSRRKSQTRQP